MKQHITQKQLSELSGKGKERLREWGLKHLRVSDWWLEYADYWKELKHMKPKDLWIERLWDGDSSEEYTRDPRQDELMWPLLSIGQMIEFLYENEGITVESNGWDDDWRLSLHWTFNSDSDWGRELDEKDGICDALWEACKEVLERK